MTPQGYVVLLIKVGGMMFDYMTYHPRQERWDLHAPERLRIQEHGWRAFYTSLWAADLKELFEVQGHMLHNGRVAAAMLGHQHMSACTFTAQAHAHPRLHPPMSLPMPLPADAICGADVTLAGGCWPARV